MEISKYRTMTNDELLDSIDQLRTELFNMRLGNTTKELKDTSKIKTARRDLARVMTVLSEKRHEAAKA